MFQRSQWHRLSFQKVYNLTHGVGYVKTAITQTEVLVGTTLRMAKEHKGQKVNSMARITNKFPMGKQEAEEKQLGGEKRIKTEKAAMHVVFK